MNIKIYYLDKIPATDRYYVASLDVLDTDVHFGSGENECSYKGLFSTSYESISMLCKLANQFPYFTWRDDMIKYSLAGRADAGDYKARYALSELIKISGIQNTYWVNHRKGKNLIERISAVGEDEIQKLSLRLLRISEGTGEN